MSGSFHVKNFEQFQHYKDRSPPWIRLYNSLLDDYEFARLPDASKAHLLAIWLLASRYDNKIPHDPEWIARRINATSKVDLDILEKAGFIVVEQDCSKTLAERKQVAIPEERRDREEQSREEVANATRAVADATRTDVEKKFNEFWAAYPSRGTAANPKKPAREKFERAVKAGEDSNKIIAAAKRYRELERKAGRDGSERVAQAMTWLNQQRWNDYALFAATGPPSGTPKFAPPPGQPTLEEIRAKYGNSNAQADRGTDVRVDAGLGEAGSDRREELQLSSGSALRREVGGT